MRKPLFIFASLMVLTTGTLASCSQSPTTSETQTQTETQSATQASQGSGTLEIRANGEDFVRQGFTSKDGWNISFNHVYVNLADITAYQSDPPFNAEAGSKVQAKEKVVLDKTHTVDLAAGGEDAEPILVEDVADAPAGQYNALSWKMVKADQGPAEGQTLVMVGTAEKEGQTIDFTVALNQPLEFVCGEFVGDERKGILAQGDTADLEATFHFDHLFGDAGAPADDEINTGALGFEPLATLANDGTLELDQEQLKSGLSPEEYQKLQEVLPSLGHVGEGHCEEIQTVANKSS